MTLTFGRVRVVVPPLIFIYADSIILNVGDIMGAFIYEGKPSDIVDYKLRDTKTGTVYDPDTYVEMVFRPHGASVWMAKWILPEGTVILPAKANNVKGTSKKRLADINLEITT